MRFTAGRFAARSGNHGKADLESNPIAQVSEPVMAPPADRPVRGKRVSFLLWFDAALFLLFLLTMTPRLTGLAIHEILGVVFAFFFLVHLLLSWPWIQSAARGLRAAGAWRTRINYSLNTVLYALTLIAIFAGLVISQVVLPAVHIPSVNDRAWHFLHNRMASLVRFGVGLHIAMNWQWIAAAVRRESASFRRRRASAETRVVSAAFENRRGGDG